MKRCVSAYSSKSEPELAFEEVCSQIEEAGVTPIAIIFTAQRSMFVYCAEQLKKRFPDSITIGSSSYINYSPKGWSHEGFSALALLSGVECAGGQLYEANRFPLNYVRHLELAMDKLSSFENTCCLEFTTAFTMGEELVLDALNSRLGPKNIPIFGGSSGMQDTDEDTCVSYNGESYVNTCVFLLIHNLNGRIAFYRENIYKPTKHFFTATDVACEERTVYEYDGKPAADVMSEILGCKGDALNEALSVHPVGRIVGDNIYITESMPVNDDGSITYYARVYNRTKLALLELDDLDRVWAETAKETAKLLPNPSFVLMVNCLGRAKLFEKENVINNFVNTVRSRYSNFVGLSGFGEQMGVEHLNQSMILALFE